jgi:hypothetical protein
MADKQLWQVTPVATDVKNDDGVIIGGQTAGTRYAPLTLIASFVHNLWASFVQACTAITSFENGDTFSVSNPTDGTRKMPKDTLLTLTSQNALAGNVAPAFDPTKPNDAGGYAYYADEIVAYQGATYKFKVNHSSGAWNATEVDRYNAGDSLKFFLVTDNPEYLYAIADDDGRFLFGIKKDGSVEWQKGCPTVIKEMFSSLSGLIEALDLSKVDREDGKSLVNETFANGVSVITNDEYLFAVVDSSEKLVFGVRKDGFVDWQEGIPAPVLDFLDSLKNSLNELNPARCITNEENDSYAAAMLDSTGNAIEVVHKNGQHEFFVKPKFADGVEWSRENIEQLAAALKLYGLNGGQGDWSDSKSLQIELPKLAIINFDGVDQMPPAKNVNYNGYMSFWDMNGNYFRKKVIMNAQGASSLAEPKKNIAIDICNDDWIGDDTFKLKLGDLVEQDSFHLKAFHTDFFRGVGLVNYILYKQILDTRGELNDRSWKKALVHADDTPWVGAGVDAETTLNKRIDNGALCFPYGFPCVVYLNGEFYGIFCFLLKKHRDNYMMKKSEKKHIHLDGIIDSIFFNGGRFWWTETEIRNPKSLYYKEAHVVKGVSTFKYDGDYPYEIADSATVAAWISNGQLPDGTVITTSIQKDLNNTAYVHSAIDLLGSRVSSIRTYAETHTIDETRAEIEKYFDPQNLIDYQIFSSIIQNIDGFAKNWQWTTWDGVKWYVNAYDLDCTYGAVANGAGIENPLNDIVGGSGPVSLIMSYYSDELEARYAELKNLGIITPRNIVKLIDDFVKTIGEGFFKLEYEKWDASPCNGDLVVNSGWKLVVDGDGKPVISNNYSNFYDSSTAYNVGETCVYNDPLAGEMMGWYYTFESTESSNMSAPVTKFAFRDSVWRLVKWIEARCEITDAIYNYQQGV